MQIYFAYVACTQFNSNILCVQARRELSKINNHTRCLRFFLSGKVWCTKTWLYVYLLCICSLFGSSLLLIMREDEEKILFEFWTMMRTSCIVYRLMRGQTPRIVWCCDADAMSSPKNFESSAAWVSHKKWWNDKWPYTL